MGHRGDEKGDEEKGNWIHTECLHHFCIGDKHLPSFLVFSSLCPLLGVIYVVATPIGVEKA